MTWEDHLNEIDRVVLIRAMEKKTELSKTDQDYIIFLSKRAMLEAQRNP